MRIFSVKKSRGESVLTSRYDTRALTAEEQYAKRRKAAREYMRKKRHPRQAAPRGPGKATPKAPKKPAKPRNKWFLLAIDGNNLGCVLAVKGTENSVRNAYAELVSEGHTYKLVGICERATIEEAEAEAVRWALEEREREGTVQPATAPTPGTESGRTREEETPSLFPSDPPAPAPLPQGTLCPRCGWTLQHTPEEATHDA